MTNLFLCERQVFFFCGHLLIQNQPIKHISDFVKFKMWWISPALGGKELIMLPN